MRSSGCPDAAYVARTFPDLESICECLTTLDDFRNYLIGAA
jgi:hypothetical protein